MKETIKRIIAGVAGGAIVAGAVLYDSLTCFFLFAVIGLVMIREFYVLFNNAKGLLPLTGMFSGLCIYSTFFLSEGGFMDRQLLLINFLPVSALLLMNLFFPERFSLRDIALILFGAVYIFVPFSFLHFVLFRPGQEGNGKEIILGLLLLQWAFDTSSYFAGKIFGRHKLWERVSPNKTWEGTTGGAVCTLGAGALLSGYIGILGVEDWIVLACITSFFGQTGDLLESRLKRIHGVKNSGNLLPGHGGVLDRFDGFIFSAPYAVMYILWFT